MMEQAHTGKRHGDIVFVRRLDDVVVTDRAAGFNNVGNAALSRALNIVAEGEERVGADGHAALARDPFLALLCAQRLGALLENALPRAVSKHIFALVGNVDVDGVVAVGAANAFDKWQGEYLRVAAEIPVVRLAAGETRAVDAALLARAHADGLAVLGVADGVRLGVFERDERNDHVALRIIRKGLIFGDDVLQKGLVDLEVVASLLEGNAEDVLLFLRGGNVGGVDLYDVVLAALFRLQDGERLLTERGGNDAVGDFALEILGGGGVALVGECGPVAVGAEAVRTAGADVGAGDGRKGLVRLNKVNPLVHSYGDALWWAFMDVTTVGSNIIAVTVTGRVLSVLLAALGMMMFPIFTVYITNLIQQSNKRKKQYYAEEEEEKEEAVGQETPAQSVQEAKT